MNLLMTKCLYQILFLNECMEIDKIKITEQLAPLYVLNKKEKTELLDMLCNDTFNGMQSTAAIIMHENFLNSFCSETNEFGYKPAERKALEIKNMVYILLDKLGDNTINFHEALFSAAFKSEHLTVSLALLYYLSGVNTDIYLPLLRRAEAHGNAEAMILLLFFEANRRLALYEKLCENREILIHNDDTLFKIENLYELNREVKKQ